MADVFKQPTHIKKTRKVEYGNHSMMPNMRASDFVSGNSVPMMQHGKHIKTKMQTSNYPGKGKKK
jgi:hypothetical protein